MKRIACIAAVTLLLLNGRINAQGTNNTLTAAEKKDGWKLLFDGTTLNGWHTYGIKGIQPQWKVDGGTIFMDSTVKPTKGDLLTDQEYSNFDLQLDWKIAPGGNSGVIFLIKEDSTKYKATYETGLEMQVLDNDRHPDGKLYKHRAGNLYDLIASKEEPVKPVGEWNHVEIILKHGQLRFFLNGVNVVTTTLWTDEWKKMVAGSKFKQWPDFGTFTSGRIALQDHDCNVWYRNIKIRLLD